jgi:hypothetical protein
MQRFGAGVPSSLNPSPLGAGVTFTATISKWTHGHDHFLQRRPLRSAQDQLARQVGYESRKLSGRALAIPCPKIRTWGTREWWGNLLNQRPGHRPFEMQRPATCRDSLHNGNSESAIRKMASSFLAGRQRYPFPRHQITLSQVAKLKISRVEQTVSVGRIWR